MYALLRIVYAVPQICKMSPSRPPGRLRPVVATRAEASSALRQRILDAAFAQFRVGGLAAVSMRKVAAEVGMSPMGLYRHFASRDLLVNAMVDCALLEFEAFLRAIPKSSKPLEQVRRFMRGYLEFALTNRTTFQLLFGATRPSNEPFLEDYKAGTSPSFELLRQTVEGAVADGALAHRNSVDASLIIWAHVHGMVTLYLAGRYGEGEALFRRFFNRSLDILLNGLGARDGS